MKLELKPADFIGRAEDGEWDRSLREALLAEPESTRATFLAEVLRGQEVARLGRARWFSLALSILVAVESYEILLKTGLDVADISSLGAWLKCCVPRLGMRRALAILREEDLARPNKVALAEYWLPRLAQSPREATLVRTFIAWRQNRAATN